jgi:hypothetical protein
MMKRLFRGNAPLTVTGCLMMAALAASLVGLAVDPRIITGAPAWLKPAKFAASIALYTLTLAWIFTFIPESVRTRRLVGWTTATALIVELVIIDLQAWRGTTSHFNVGTVFDGVLWTVMGLTIVVQSLSSVAVAVALWRQNISDRALGWALALGMTITIVGAFSGGLMAQPTRAQVAAARSGQPMRIAGAHTIGAADGGRGIPGTGWSLEHGDLRVPHFLGLHAMQALPLVALGLRRRRFTEPARVRLTLTAAGSYVGLFSLLLWQALRGQSVLATDAPALAAVAAWAATTAAAAWFSRDQRAPVHSAVTV